MAKAKVTTGVVLKTLPKVRRPGVNAKTKTSRLKSSKLYKKKYRGQG